METLIRIELPYATCGVIAEGGIVKRAAPIVGWMKGKTVEAVESWVRSKGGKFTHHYNLATDGTTVVVAKKED